MDDQQLTNEQQFLTPKDVLGYAEDFIIFEDTKELTNYSLSNNLDDIEIAIYAKTGFNINLENAYWESNQGLSINVKHLMNKHHANYSMSVRYDDKNKKCLSINMRVDDKWYITMYIEINGKIYNYEEFLIQKKTLKILLEFLDIDVNNLNDLLDDE